MFFCIMVKLYFLVEWNVVFWLLFMVFLIRESVECFVVICLFNGVNLLLIFVLIGNLVVINKFEVCVLIIFCRYVFNMIVF